MREKDISWIVNLRCFATICVIIIHVSFPLLSLTDFPNYYWWSGNLFDSFGRCSVPVFVMLTGYLFLPKPLIINNFFANRVKKLLLPFICWNFIYILILYRWGYPETNAFQFLINIAIPKMILGKVSYHFWYIYMLILLYLILPLLGSILKGISNNGLLLLLLIWGISVGFGKFIGFSELDPRNFAFYIGYLIVGYSFSRNFSFLQHKKLHVFAIIGFLIGLSVTVIGTYKISTIESRFNGFFYGYFSPNVFVMAVSVFLFFKCKLDKKPHWIIEILDRYSYGIYLVHVLVLYYLRRLDLNCNLLSPIIGIPLTTIVCLFISCFINIFLAKLGHYLFSNNAESKMKIVKRM
ncbi:acyltransferase [Pedobacter kyungheensis]|nr:acyltransferase family protein [Pedobacter kyungheensis]